MIAARRARKIYAWWVALVIAAGLASRRPGMPAFIVAYAGDVLWGAMFFLLFALLKPLRSRFRTACFAIATTEFIEFSELYHPGWLDRLRDTRFGGLLLGHQFLWSDVICVAVGASVAGWVDWQITRKGAVRSPVV